MILVNIKSDTINMYGVFTNDLSFNTYYNNWILSLPESVVPLASKTTMALGILNTTEGAVVPTVVITRTQFELDTVLFNSDYLERGN